ncbi:MAG: magnesium/cobalt efflux protein [Tagaea sp. CACIAM 22H2]|jgi:CBS domain containing-hemolysin-like protein|nr:magnesium/cobalt efflux protein [Tagaea sp. CACIAM 22H2]
MSESQTSFADRLRGRLRDLLRPKGGAAEEQLRDTIEEIIEESETPAEPMGAAERAILSNVLRLREVTAEDVMVPRADIVAIELDVDLDKLAAFLAREAHSRVPVYRGTLDDVVGFVHLKDVLRARETKSGAKLADVMRKVIFVAPSMRVLDLLLEMRKTRTHIALVVDEFGGVDGLVTIEDVVEAIVGDIEDEHDVDERPRLQKVADGWLVDSRVSIEEFQNQTGLTLDDETREADIDTVGGAVAAMAGRVPGRGEVIRHAAGCEFEIIDADPRRIKRLKARAAPAAQSQETAAE